MPALAVGTLSSKQEAFAREYVRLGNKTRAAIKAGYTAQTADKWAWQLTNPDRYPLVCEYIDKLQAEKRQAMAATEERMALELARIAYLDIEACYDENGKPLPLADMPEDARRALQAVKTFTRETKDDDGETISETKIIDVVAASKLQALKQLADLKGMGRGNGNTINNLNVAAASASVDWSSFKEEPMPVDDVMAQVEEARALAEAKEELRNGDGRHETNGHT